MEERRQEGNAEPGMKELELILDSLEAGVYVADIETYEILYANRYVRERFGPENPVGKRCYEVFHIGRHAPCDWCNKPRLVEGSKTGTWVESREVLNARLNTCFSIRDHLIYWNGNRPARLGLAVDGDCPGDCPESLLEPRAEAKERVKAWSLQLEAAQRELQRAREEWLEQQAHNEKLNRELMELNGALRVLARNLDTAKNEAERHTTSRICGRMKPLLHKMLAAASNENCKSLVESMLSYLDACDDAKDHAYLLERLTMTELKIASLIRDGKKNLEIADKLCISENTVKTHRRNIRKKLQLSGRDNLRRFLQFAGFDGEAAGRADPNGRHTH